MLLRAVLLAATPLVFAVPTQKYFGSVGDVAEKVQRTPAEIISWALNPLGDAAIIETRTCDGAHDARDFHLLAINAQYTIPSVHLGPTISDGLYTFLDDEHLISLRSQDGFTWEVMTHYVNYTSGHPAFPPSLQEEKVRGVLDHLGGRPLEIQVAGSGAQKTLLIVLETTSKRRVVQFIKLRRSSELSSNCVAFDDDTSKSVVEVTTAGDQVGFVTKDADGSHEIYTLDLGHDATPKPRGGAHVQRISSLSFGHGGQTAWLLHGDHATQLLLHRNGQTWTVPLKWDLSPYKVIFSKDGSAINLLTPHGDQQSLFHLWTPESPATYPVTPARIPSTGFIHSVIHVGITPLNHSHLIGVKSSATERKELWVISHSPGSNPTDNYENIRLTFFTDAD